MTFQEEGEEKEEEDQDQDQDQDPDQDHQWLCPSCHCKKSVCIFLEEVPLDRSVVAVRQTPVPWFHVFLGRKIFN